MLFINFPGNYDAHQSWRTTGLIKEKIEILGSIEGLAEFGLSEYLTTVKEAEINV